MINRVILIGRLTKDPVMRKTQSGTSVVSFTLAVERRVKTQDQTADFINCVAWNKTAELITQYLHKGSQTAVEGRIQTRSYDDQTGRKVYVTEVVADSVQFLDSKNSSQGASAQVHEDNTYTNDSGYVSDPTPDAASSYTSDFSSSDTLDIASDDLPF
ncbi:MAG: single-stranded DNA-binding protein [Erysipelotrichaceae bacterium]